jgi:CheY-like chemotaxis protein
VRTILVVDDDAWVRVLARDVLAGEGYRVLEASDGQDAIRVAAEHPGPIHLLLTDVVMPGMSGPQVAEKLLERNPTLKILFTSGYAEDAIDSHGVLSPGAAFLGKPFSAAELAGKLRELLDLTSN